MHGDSATLRRRLGFLTVPLVGAALAVQSASTLTTAYAPPPGPTTTTPQRVPAVIATPTTTTTTRPTTTTTTPVIIAPPTTTSPPLGDLVAVTTTTPATTTSTATTHATAQLATTTAPAVIAQQPATTTVPGLIAVTSPLDGGEPVSIGTWSTDPGDWSDEVLDYLADEGIDVATLGDQAGGTPGQLLSNEGCSVQCITSGLMWPVGVGAYLEVKTAVPATITIEVLSASPEKQTGPAGQKIWGATWPHLQPATTYQALARAHDASGNIAVAFGEFTTFSRSATITLTPTTFWLGNDTDIDPWHDYDWHRHATASLDGVQVATGEQTAMVAAPTLTIGTTKNGPAIVEVTYRGSFHAHSPKPESCPIGGCIDQAVSDAPSGSHGVYGSWWWGTVGNGIQLDGYPDDTTYWIGHEFTFPLSTFFGDPVGPPVYLTVNVTVDVSYQP